ncbi:MAG: site-2 protease family protein [Pirellulaceae bacterium]
MPHRRRLADPQIEGDYPLFLAEPQRTPYDFHFQVLGFPVRVTPFFWIVAALLGYEMARGLRDVRPGQFVWLVIWVAAVFLSILVHELGHALMMRRYGSSASVVLYHFGGLAIPGGYSVWGTSSRRRDPNQQIWISLAGPGAQLGLAAAILMALRVFGFRSLVDTVWPIDILFPTAAEKRLPLALDVSLLFLVLPSIFWALINLLPIYPLDGGHVARELFSMFGGADAVRWSLGLSLGTAIAAAVYLFTHGQSFNALLFVSLAVSNYQMLQMLRFGGGPW